MTNRVYTDVLVVGAGVAGLSLALRLADQRRVAILAKGPLTEGSSLYAQGGIAAVTDSLDSFEEHIQDSLEAGGTLCHKTTVKQVVERGPAIIQWLIEQGVGFTRKKGQGFHLTREGGHNKRRVLHADDATGRAIETTLEKQVLNHDNIDVYPHHIAIDLITNQKLGIEHDNHCLGAYVFDKRETSVKVFQAKQVVLATGGASKAYLYTSNPDTSTGDGIAMAWRAGCRVGNMEFVQFHPTCLYDPRAKSFLISEALRGEGGKLRLPDGSSFMEEHDPRGELAPRDVVARAIDYEMKKHGLDHVNLVMHHLPADFIRSHFPTIYARCMDYGYDITKEPIPVVPAAHYTCGGIVTDPRARTDIANLYAVGECAFTGLHGANRLASNSLLECLVFAEAAAEDIKTRPEDDEQASPLIPEWDESLVVDADEQVVVSHNWNELRHLMWDYVGIVRTTKRLKRAQRRIELLSDEIIEYYSNFRINNDLLELRNLVTVAELIVHCALERKESRGLHHTRDYPESFADEQAVDTILTPKGYVDNGNANWDESVA